MTISDISLPLPPSRCRCRRRRRCRCRRCRRCRRRCCRRRRCRCRRRRRCRCRRRRRLAAMIMRAAHVGTDAHDELLMN